MRQLARFVCFLNQYEPYSEFETLSLRQPLRYQHSPPACEAPEIPNKYGPPRTNLRTAIGC
jgi:hypothetical protein